MDSTLPPTADIAPACRFDWCDCPHRGHDEHSAQMPYVPSTMNSDHRNGITVGVGVNFVDGDDAPAVYVHIDGGLSEHPEIDEDAYLSVSEAGQLLANLNRSVRLAESLAR